MELRRQRADLREHGLERLARRVPEDVDVEAVRERRVGNRARLDLRQRQVARREAHEDLAEHARSIGEREHERRLRLRALGQRRGTQADLDEARRVADRALDLRREDREAVALRRGRARDRTPRAITGFGDVTRGARGVELGTRDEVRMRGEEVLALRERLRMRHHDAQVIDRGAGHREQAVLDRADDLAGDAEVPAGEEVVRLVDAARGRVLDRQQREIRGAVVHGLRRTLERIVAGEQRTSGTTAVAQLRGEVAVAALDALVRDAQRDVLAGAHAHLLVRDAHVHHDAVEPLDLVRVEARLGRLVPQALQQELLALAIAERARARELRLGDLLDDLQPLREQRDDLAVDRFDAVTQGRELGGGHGDTVLSWRGDAP